MIRSRRILVAVASGASLAILLGAAPSFAGSRPCTEPSPVPAADVQSTIIARNLRSTPLTIEWDDTRGAAKHFVTLAPDETRRIQAYGNHGLMSRDARQRCLSRFVSESQLETWEIVTTLDGDYDSRTVGPFHVYVSPEYKLHESRVLQECMRVLEDNAKRLQESLPAEALQKLAVVPIWLEYEADSLYGGRYLPSQDWLAANGMTRAKAKSIEFTRSLAAFLNSKRNPLLHELAHAYHDLVLSLSDASIWSAYQHARLGGLYNAVRDSTGVWQQAYAMQNYAEFFAELSEAYFGTNDLFPFTREDLRKYDPDSYRVVSDAWERPNVQRSKQPTTSDIRFQFSR